MVGAKNITIINRIYCVKYIYKNRNYRATGLLINN